MLAKCDKIISNLKPKKGNLLIEKNFERLVLLKTYIPPKYLCLEHVVFCSLLDDIGALFFKDADTTKKDYLMTTTEKKDRLQKLDNFIIPASLQNTFSKEQSLIQIFCSILIMYFRIHYKLIKITKSYKNGPCMVHFEQIENGTLGTYSDQVRMQDIVEKICKTYNKKYDIIYSTLIFNISIPKDTMISTITINLWTDNSDNFYEKCDKHKKLTKILIRNIKEKTKEIEQLCTQIEQVCKYEMLDSIKIEAFEIALIQMFHDAIENPQLDTIEWFYADKLAYNFEELPIKPSYTQTIKLIPLTFQQFAEFMDLNYQSPNIISYRRENVCEAKLAELKRKIEIFRGILDR